MVFEQEAAFETALITLLTEKYGWEPEILRYKTEEDLIQNWKQILFENNREVDRLNDVPLTDGEMQQILDQITRLRTPLKLNGFINGKTVAIKRDNPADELHFGKEVSLKIYVDHILQVHHKRRSYTFPTHCCYRVCSAIWQYQE